MASDIDPGHQILLGRGEWMIIAALMDMAAECFESRGNNNLSSELVALIPEDDWSAMASLVSADDELDDPAIAQRDDVLMRFYARLIRKHLVECPDVPATGGNS